MQTFNKNNFFKQQTADTLTNDNRNDNWSSSLSVGGEVIGENQLTTERKELHDDVVDKGYSVMLVREEGSASNEAQ